MSNQVVTHNQYQYSEEEPSIYNFNSKFMLGAFTCLVIVIAFVLFLHVYASWFLRWFQGSSSSSSTRMQDRTHILVLDGEHVSSRGLEACVVSSLPVFVYRCEGEKEGEMECAVCLSLFEDGEKGRVLPVCNHGFHIKCIDSWLECSSTCPICRASAMPGSIDVEIEMGGGEVRQGSNTTSESNMDGTTMVERNPNGDSLLEVCVEISGSMVDQEQPQSACSSLSSLRRMLSKNRLEKKVFPSMGEEDMEKD